MIILCMLLAGDAAKLDVLGFSPDGTKAAFVQYGIHDGSGAAWATGYIVDVAKNGFSGKPHVFDGDPEKDEKDEEVMHKRALAALGKQWKKGKTLALDGEGRLVGSDAGIHFVAEAHASGSKSCDEEASKMVSVEMGFTGGDPPVVLQRDKQLPKSRGCVMEYFIDSAYAQGMSLLVIVRYQARGFEGPDLRYMAVTGKLDFSP